MKKITHYFVYVGHSTQTKNKLQKEFEKYLKSLEGNLTEVSQLGKLKEEIITKSEELNEVFKNCKPLKISFYGLYTKNGFMIEGFHFLTFQILQAHYDNNR